MFTAGIFGNTVRARVPACGHEPPGQGIPARASKQMVVWAGNLWRSCHVRRPLARQRGPGHRSCRSQAAADRGHRRHPDGNRPDYRHGDRVRRGYRSSAPGHPPAHPHGSPRPPGWPGGQGLRNGLGPRGLLRFGHRQGGRRPVARRRGLVPGHDPSGPPGPAAVRGARGDVPGVIPAGESGVARHLGQGRPHGASRADDPPGHRLLVRFVPGPRPVGAVGVDRADRHRPLREGLAPGRSPGSRGGGAPDLGGRAPWRAARVVAPQVRRRGGGPAGKANCPAGQAVPGGPVRPDRVSVTGPRLGVTADICPSSAPD